MGVKLLSFSVVVATDLLKSNSEFWNTWALCLDNICLNPLLSLGCLSCLIDLNICFVLSILIICFFLWDKLFPYCLLSYPLVSGNLLRPDFAQSSTIMWRTKIHFSHSCVCCTVVNSCTVSTRNTFHIRECLHGIKEFS